MPLIMHFVNLEEEQGDDELKESCLQAFEALALRCYREISPYIKEVCVCGATYCNCCAGCRVSVR